MTYQARVLGRWSMDLPETVEGKPWFLDWVIRSPAQVSTHIAAGWHAYRSLLQVYGGELMSAYEYFGGMGAQALVIDELFRPVVHVVADNSPEAVAHLQKVLPESILAVRHDAYMPITGTSDDLVGLDFGDLTAWKTREGEKHRELLDQVFAGKPKAVVLTDIAGPRLHLQRDRYETLLGVGSCDNYNSYLCAFVNRLRSLYGYGLLAGYTHRWSTVMALVPEDKRPHGYPLHHVPETPVGLILQRRNP